jgi:hypothetical protein
MRAWWSQRSTNAQTFIAAGAIIVVLFVVVAITGGSGKNAAPSTAASPPPVTAAVTCGSGTSLSGDTCVATPSAPKIRKVYVTRTVTVTETTPAATASSPPTPSTPSPSSGPAIEGVGSSSHDTDAQFCAMNQCIGAFTTEPGTIVQCADGTYSHSGGISGACSRHGGEQ